MVREILNDFGSIDILVNNASAFFPTPLFKIGEKEWDEIFAVNLKAPFFLSQAFGREMRRKGGGRIIQIADWIARRPLAGFLPYSVSKAALIALTRGLAKELSPEVLVTAVCPGPVLAPPHLTRKQKLGIAKRTLVGRWGRVQDVVEMVIMLAKQNFVSGSYHLVDGGAELVG
jgi:pteridine reductase